MREKTMRKRILPVLLAAAMMLTMTPSAYAGANENEAVDNTESSSAEEVIAESENNEDHSDKTEVVANSYSLGSLVGTDNDNTSKTEQTGKDGTGTPTSSSDVQTSGGLTRGELVTLLWKFAGSPEPISSDPQIADVKSEDVAKAASWAIGTGITAAEAGTLR